MGSGRRRCPLQLEAGLPFPLSALDDPEEPFVVGRFMAARLDIIIQNHRSINKQIGTFDFQVGDFRCQNYRRMIFQRIVC
jgi:hypothetical protein